MFRRDFFVRAAAAMSGMLLGFVGRKPAQAAVEQVTTDFLGVPWDVKIVKDLVPSDDLPIMFAAPEFTPWLIDVDGNAVSTIFNAKFAEPSANYLHKNEHLEMYEAMLVASYTGIRQITLSLANCAAAAVEKATREPQFWEIHGMQPLGVPGVRDCFHRSLQCPDTGLILPLKLIFQDLISCGFNLQFSWAEAGEYPTYIVTHPDTKVRRAWAIIDEPLPFAARRYQDYIGVSWTKLVDHPVSRDDESDFAKNLDFAFVARDVKDL